MYWLPYSSHTSHHPSQTPCLPWISYAKTDARFMQDGRKAVWSIPYVSVAFFPSLKQNFIAYRSSKVSSRPDCIFEIHQQWQSGFSRVYFNCCWSCSFEAEIINIGQSSHKMYSNNMVNFQESTTILNASSLETYWSHHVYIYIYIYIYIWEREREREREREVKKRCSADDLIYSWINVKHFSFFYTGRLKIDATHLYENDLLLKWAQ